MLLEPGSSAPTLGIRALRGLYVMESADIQIYLPLLIAVLLSRGRIAQSGFPLAGLVGWYLCDLFAANASGAYYGHQMRQPLPALALLGALGVWAMVRGGFTLEPIRRHHRTLIAIAIFFIWWTLPGTFMSNVGASSIKKTAEWVRRHTTEQDYVYVFATVDANPIIASTGRQASSRYFNQFFHSAPGVMETIQRDIDANPPVYLVLQRDGKMGLQPITDIPGWVYTLLATQYEEEKEFNYLVEARFGEVLRGFTVYRRKGTAAVPANR